MYPCWVDTDPLETDPNQRLQYFEPEPRTLGTDVCRRPVFVGTVVRTTDFFIVFLAPIPGNDHKRNLRHLARHVEASKEVSVDDNATAAMALEFFRLEMDYAAELLFHQLVFPF
jgi:hypothetical protein